MTRFDHKPADRIPWQEIPGGQELVDYFGHDPEFGDAEVVQLVLNRRAPSLISIHTWSNDSFDQAKHVVVTLTVSDIADVELEHFSHQNVLNDLVIRPAPERAERHPYYGRKPRPEDIEIQLGPCYGLNGFIRASAVSISFVRGLPHDMKRL